MRVRVLGAGIVGLACAWELIGRGHDVEVVDDHPGSGASWAAAGMLSPAGELWHGETALLGLGLESAALWPAYASGLGVPLLRTGTLLAGADNGDLQEIDRQLGLLEAVGIEVEPLSRRELLAREPALGRVVGGAWLPEDHSVDPRLVLAALRARVPVVSVSTGSTSGTVGVTVIATGARLPAPFAGLVRPVRGEILRVGLRSGAPTATVRGLVHGEPVYVVPRAGSDEVVIGATSQEHDGPPAPSVEGVSRLLDAARVLLPGLDRAEFREAIARDRPGTRDNLPLIGPVSTGSTSAGRVLLAAGHYRHGVLLAPLTARLIADQIDLGPEPPCRQAGRAAVDPRRFALKTSPA